MSVFTSIPANSEAKKDGQLSPAQLKQFFDDGFLVLHDYLDKTLLEPCKADIDKKVDEVATKLVKAGKIKDACHDAPHEERLSRIEAQFPGATILMHKDDSTEPGIRALWSGAKLGNLAEQLLGPDVDGHPVWNIRPKVPECANHDVPWHQDAAYLEASGDGTLMVTAWVPLLDVAEENGTLQFLRGAHGKGLGQHQGMWGDTWYIYMSEEGKKEIGVNEGTEIVTCEIPYGGLVIFNNMVPHRSLPNLSDTIRWSLDLRWCPAAQPIGFKAKPSIAFRRDGTSVKPDWNSLDARNRATFMCHSGTEFDTVLSPEIWMKRWPLLHGNRHSDAFTARPEKTAI